jgi:hypothetical protein
MQGRVSGGCFLVRPPQGPVRPCNGQAFYAENTARQSHFYAEKNTASQLHFFMQKNPAKLSHFMQRNTSNQSHF